MKKYKEKIKNLDDRGLVICKRCKYDWFSKSLEKWVKCPNCGTSVKNLDL